MQVIESLAWTKASWDSGVAAKAVDIPVVTNSPHPELYFLGGWGEEEKAVSSVIDHLGTVGIAAAGILLPFTELPATTTNIVKTCIDGPIAVMDYFDTKSAHLLGHSKGGAEVVMAANEAPERANGLLLWAPFGLNTDKIGSTREFLMRLTIKNSLQREQSLLDPGNRVAGGEIAHRFVEDIKTRRFLPKVRAAMLEDTFPALVNLHSQMPIKVFLAADDPVFPTAEHTERFRTSGIEDTITDIPGSHCSPLSRVGKKQLEIVTHYAIQFITDSKSATE